MAVELKEALQIIQSGDWLQSLQFITADLTKNCGGQIINLAKCRIARKRATEFDNNKSTQFSNTSKPANHNKNFTLNLELQNKQIRKVHPILITQINNCQVI